MRNLSRKCEMINRGCVTTVPIFSALVGVSCVHSVCVPPCLLPQVFGNPLPPPALPQAINHTRSVDLVVWIFLPRPPSATSQDPRKCAISSAKIFSKMCKKISRNPRLHGSKRSHEFPSFSRFTGERSQERTRSSATRTKRSQQRREPDQKKAERFPTATSR